MVVHFGNVTVVTYGIRLKPLANARNALKHGRILNAQALVTQEVVVHGPNI
jgi:hypothetical protein